MPSVAAYDSPVTPSETPAADAALLTEEVLEDEVEEASLTPEWKEANKRIEKEVRKQKVRKKQTHQTQFS